MTRIPRRPLARALMLLSAASLARAQTDLYRIQGVTPGIRLGTFVAPAGDVDGDGVPDFLAGSGPGASAAGLVQIFAGRTGAQLLSFQTGAVGDWLGVSGCSLGDVDGDGVPDFVVGAPRHVNHSGSTTGQVYVVSGRTASILLTIDHAVSGAGIGRSVAATGDVDHDGVPDFAEGSGWFWPDGTTQGEACVFSGRTGALIFRLSNTLGHGGIGTMVAGPGDVDGDGYPDVLVGEAFSTTNGAQLGKASLYSGRTGTLIRSYLGPMSGSDFGAAVAAAGDVDGDGVPDIAVGAPGDASHGSLSGSVRIYSGADGSRLRILYGNPGDRLGANLSGGEDVDGDGRPDLAVGAPGATVAGSPGGLVRVFSGRDGRLLAEIPCRAPQEEVGPCALLGDLNGDGQGDVAVGAPGAGDGGPASGSARVYLLGTPTPAPYCWWKWNSLNCASTPFVDGAPSLSVGEGLRVHVGGVLNHRPGFLVWGLARADAPFGGGTLCVQVLHRTRIQDSGGNPGGGTDCSGTLAFRFTPSYLAAHGVSAGTRVYCQFVSRDDGFPPPDNVGLSQGLAFTVLP